MKKQTVWIPVFAILAYVLSGHGGLVHDGVAGEVMPVIYGASLGLCFTLALGLRPRRDSSLAVAFASLLSVALFYLAFSWSESNKLMLAIWPVVYASPAVAIFVARRYSGSKR